MAGNREDGQLSECSSTGATVTEEDLLTCLDFGVFPLASRSDSAHFTALEQKMSKKKKSLPNRVPESENTR